MKRIYKILLLVFGCFVSALSTVSQPKTVNMDRLLRQKEAYVDEKDFFFSERNAHPTLQIQSLIPLYDSVYYYSNWNSVLGTWINIPNSKEINFVYDAGNRLTEKLLQMNTNGWQNSHYYTYTYDGNNNKLSEIDQTWNGTTWINYTKVEYTYDMNNNMLNKTYFNGDTSSWINNKQYIYTYDINNHKITEIRQDWFGNLWQNRTKTTNTYDVNDDLTNVLYQNWSTSWNNFEQWINIYDNNHNQISLTSQDWNINLNAWKNSDQLLYTYNLNNNWTYILGQSWDNSSWVNSEQTFYTYDPNQNLIDVLSQNWSGSIWYVWYEYTNAYNANNYLVQWDKYTGAVGLPSVHGNNYYDLNNILQSSTRMQYSTSLTYFTDGDSTQYYYHTVTSIKNNKPQTSISITPNPTHSTFTITTTLQHPTIITLHDITGRVVLQQTIISTTTPIDISTLSNGIYIAELKDKEGRSVVGKVVKE